MTDDFFKELNEVLEAEARKFRTEELREGDYTLERVMKEKGVSQSQARKILNRLAALGYFEKIRIRNPNGGGAWVAFRPVPSERKKG